VNDEQLDQLLSQATWPEATQSSRRLREQWSELTRRRTRSWGGAFAAAAVIVIATGITWIVLRPDVTPPAIVMNHPVPVPVAIEKPRELGREPTIVELALLRRPPAPPVKVEEDSTAIEARLARMIEQREGRNIASETARKFCDVATAKSLPVVMKLWRNENLRDETIAAVIRLADAPGLVQAARETKEPVERRRLIAALLNRPAPQAMPLYLSLVDEMKNDALAALDQLNRPPTDALMAQLSSPRGDHRIAAALALGHIDGPATTRRLIDMIAADRNKREAFIALASSRGQEAQAFVRRAATSEQFASLAQSAMVQTEIR
jgi:hypothetical protein